MAGVVMNKTKFTVRVDAETLNSAKQYARQHSITVTDLVEEFFRSLNKVNEISYETPILAELAGSLSADVSIENYRTHLEEKYLGDKHTGR
jgi:antitoxin component of RelBE/YafQ-DinJ toxin-antitoxin module